VSGRGAQDEAGGGLDHEFVEWWNRLILETANNVSLAFSNSTIQRFNR